MQDTNLIQEGIFPCLQWNSDKKIHKVRKGQFALARRSRSLLISSTMGAFVCMSLTFMPISTASASPALQTHNTAANGLVIGTTPISTNMSYPEIARQAAINAGIDPNYFVRQIQQESGFNPNAQSSVGAIGIAQFMPATAVSMGVNPYDPVQALNGAAQMMAQLNGQFGGDYAKALAAYNAGPGNVQSAVKQGGNNWRAFLPGETQNYLSTIMG